MLPSRSRFLVALGLSMVCGLLVGAQEATDEPQSLENRVREVIQAAFDGQELVGLSVGIIRGGELDHTIHLGWEDWEKEVATSSSTMYRWASISKPLTAVVAMQLVEEQKLDLDRDIREYVAEFPEKPWAIFARQLLCHQGGIVHYTNGPVVPAVREYEVENPFADTVLAIDKFKESPLVAEPGTTFSYTTHGYMLLGAVVERAGDQKFADQVRERIFDPLGMTTARPDYEWEEIPNRAVGYRRSGSGARPVVSHDVSWKLPGGGYISTVGDLARFGVGMLRNDLVEPLTRERMWTPKKTSNGASTGYGFGFGVTSEAELDIKFVGHSGSQQKTRTHLLICPETGDGVAIMSNSEWASLRQLITSILRMLAEDTLDEANQPRRQAA